MTDIRDVVIVRVGAQGDGVSDGPDGPEFVPFALAGERVRASFDGPAFCPPKMRSWFAAATPP